MYNNLTNITTESWSWPWWGVMVTVNIISTIVFIYLMIRMFKTVKKESKNSKYLKTLAIFGTIYVGVALYRSVFVSSYTGQKAWFDSMANSMVIIRSLAFFAEISFACLIGLGLRHMNQELELPESIQKRTWLKKYLLASPYIIIACLCTAQIFAWTGLLTQYVFLFAIEETLWALGFTSVLPLIIIQLNNLCTNYKNDSSLRMYKSFLLVLSIFTVGYLLFQYAYQLPFGYYLEIANDMANGTHYPLNVDSFIRAFEELHPTRSFEEWGGLGFFIWHSGYFSICVWMNIFFACGPRLLKK